MLTNTCQQYTSCLLPLRLARDSPHFRGLLCPPRPLSPSRFRSVFEERASEFPFCISCTHWGQTILKTFRPVVSGDSELNLLNHAKAVLWVWTDGLLLRHSTRKQLQPPWTRGDSGWICNGGRATVPRPTPVKPCKLRTGRETSASSLTSLQVTTESGMEATI